MRTRIKDVAERAGVSTATVSVVLNNTEGARVAAQTRERVEAAARELGYAPNSVARSLRTQRTHTLGLISDRIVTTPYAGRMIQGAQDAAWNAGYVLVVINTGGDQRLEREAINALLARQVDGLLYGTMYHRIVEVPEPLRMRPVVLLDAEPRHRGVAGVVPDEFEGGRMAARVLLDAGHRRIAHLAEVLDVPAARLRLDGFRAELDSAGVYDERLVVADESDSAGGERAAMALLSEPDRPSAVFCYNDRMAMGVYRAAAELGLRIPVDLSVLGFDDQELVAAELSPGLSTIALPHHAMGRIAVETLVAHIGELAGDASAADVPRTVRLVTCPLVERQSIGPPPAALASS